MPAAAAPRRRRRVLLGVSGSVAAVKWPQLVVALSRHADVRVMATSASQAFADATAAYDAAALAAACDVLRATEARLAADGERTHASTAAGAPAPIFVDADEWRAYSAVHAGTVLHIELRKWADVLLLAPLSANTLAKVACGLADNLVTCVARAWDFSDAAKAFIVAPAMNTAMLAHPVTAPQLRQLREWGVVVLPTATKTLACGDVGAGAMASVGDIAALVAAAAAGGDAWRLAAAPYVTAPGAATPHS